MKIKIAMGQISAEKSIEATLEKAGRQIDEASLKGAKLICFPEVGFEEFFPQYRADPVKFASAEPIPGPITEYLCKKAGERDIVIIASFLEEGFPGEYYDSAVCIDADGTLLGTTRMVHVYEGKNYNEKFYYGPGNTLYPVYDTAAGPVGIAICQDSWYPEVMRCLAIRGAELIVVPTAECGPQGEEQQKHHFDVLTSMYKASAVVNGLYVGMANRVGVEDTMEFMGASFVVDPTGRLLQCANRDSDEVLVAEIDNSLIRQVRQTNPLLRDRRVDTYGLLLKPWASEVTYHERVRI